VNALADPSVGEYLNRHFVSAFQKVATFTVNGGQKQGGNVAAYFCTADGRVLHAIAGPVDAMTFLREARWANETAQLAALERGSADQVDFFRKAHLDRLHREHGRQIAPSRLPPPDRVTREFVHQLAAQNRHVGLSNQGKVHLILGVAPNPRLAQVYRVVFENILNERISTDPVRIAGR
jgi:hypothetical protein